MRFSFKILLMILTAFFLIGLLSLQGVFAQEIKKPKPSNPFLGEEEGAVNASRSFRANIAGSFKKHRPKGIKLVVDKAGSGDFIDIQSAIDAALDGDKIEVMPGIYSGFSVVRRSYLKIEGKKGKKAKSENVIVTGSVMVTTYRRTYNTTIGVVDSTDIEISHFTVQAGYSDPFSIAYFNSTGKVKHNEVSGNTGNRNPGNGIAAFGISSPGTVTIEHNYIHDYGKIGILVNSQRGTESVPGGIHAKIKHNIIVGTDFADYSRVQDGIQVTYGGSADIEHNNISENFQTGGSRWTCDGLMFYDAHEVKTKKNKLYNNQMGIAIQKYVCDVKLEDDDIKYNERGLYTWNWYPSTIVVKKAKIKENEYGWFNWDTDGIVFEHCHLEKNIYGLYNGGYYTGFSAPTATFKHCKITKNTEYDVLQGSRLNTLVFLKTKYDTYYNYGGGTLIED
jgi:hypothetical protein